MMAWFRTSADTGVVTVPKPRALAAVDEWYDVDDVDERQARYVEGLESLTTPEGWRGLAALRLGLDRDELEHFLGDFDHDLVVAWCGVALGEAHRKRLRIRHTPMIGERVQVVTEVVGDTLEVAIYSPDRVVEPQPQEIGG